MRRGMIYGLAVVLALSMVGCGGPAEEGEKQVPSVSETGPVEDRQEKSTGKAEIEETVLLDESGMTITAKSLSTDGVFGPEIKLLIENETGKNLTVQCRNASVNGYMMQTMLSADVVTGKKANESLTFMKADLEACGISTIADMEFSFHIFTSDDWETWLDSPQIQLKTSAAEGYAYAFDDSGETVYEADGIRVIVRGLVEDESIFGPGIVVYMENNAQQDITVQTRDVSVNGFMVNALFSSDVMVGKHAVNTITFLSSELEENDITEIEDVELSFHIFNSDSWETIVDTQTIAMTF